MRIGIAFGLAAIAPTLILSACSPALRPVVRQAAALSPGPRTIALAQAPPDVTRAAMPDRVAIGRALAQAGYALRPSAADARYLLVLTVADGPRQVGSLLPPEGDAGAQPVRWVARPRRGLVTSFGPAEVVRVSALVIEGATGREVWRGTLSSPRGKSPDQVSSLAARVLAELPHGQSAGGS